jgi:hypothetical protein
MKRFPCAAAVVFTFIASNLLLMAQEAAIHAPDGGTRERVESIAIPSMPNAPFRAVVTTEWTRLLPDGSTQTNKNHRTVARDSSGRVFQERRYFMPDGDKQVTPLTELDYQDPNRHELSICRPNTRVCTVYKFDMPANNLQEAPLPKGMGSVTHENLGQKTVDGLQLAGSREITTINAGVIGNQKAEPIVKEFWYSPRLGINVITKQFDPRVSAAQNVEVGSIDLAEPDPKLFERPTDYKVVRMDTR